MFEGKNVKVLLAQAGSGKTRRLIEEVSEELKTRRPEELAFVTFTRKGAEEGLHRAAHGLAGHGDRPGEGEDAGRGLAALRGDAHGEALV